MEIIKDQYFEGERPLYARHGLSLDHIVFGPGESAVKEGSDIEAENCEFQGKYPFWECRNVTVRNCIFREGSRAAIWYSKDCRMQDCLVEAPKMFRRISGVRLENVKFPYALETFWDCKDIEAKDIEVEQGDYLFMHSSDIRIDGFRLRGNYSFQYAKDVVIRNADMETKDAFWEAKDVTVYDSRIRGEYLGWYSKNLHLVNCRIGGTQPPSPSSIRTSRQASSGRLRASRTPVPAGSMPTATAKSSWTATSRRPPTVKSAPGPSRTLTWPPARKSLNIRFLDFARNDKIQF